jgi:CBS domain-containing protein
MTKKKSNSSKRRGFKKLKKSKEIKKQTRKSKKNKIKQQIRKSKKVETRQPGRKETVEKIVKEEIKTQNIEIETKVKDVMTTNLKVANVDQNLREIIELLADFNITGLPIKDKNRIVGVISDTDILKVMDSKSILDAKKDEVKLSKLEQIKAESIMSKPPITINQNEKITDASELMTKKGIDRLIVVDDDNKTVGIATREDLMRGLTTEFFMKTMEKSGGTVISSIVDLILTRVREKGSVKIKDLAKELNQKPKDLEELAKILEEKGLVEISYPLFGLPKIKVKK